MTILTISKTIATTHSIVTAKVDSTGHISLCAEENFDGEAYIYADWITPETAAAFIEVLGSVMKAAKQRFVA